MLRNLSNTFMYIIWVPSSCAVLLFGILNAIRNFFVPLDLSLHAIKPVK